MTAEELEGTLTLSCTAQGLWRLPANFKMYGSNWAVSRQSAYGYRSAESRLSGNYPIANRPSVTNGSRKLVVARKSEQFLPRQPHQFATTPCPETIADNRRRLRVMTVTDAVTVMAYFGTGVEYALHCLIWIAGPLKQP